MTALKNRHRGPTSGKVRCTFKPVISDLNFAVLDRPEVAVNGSSRLAGMLSHRRRSWEV